LTLYIPVCMHVHEIPVCMHVHERRTDFFSCEGNKN
jgi:hypothetical protein